MKYAVQFSDKNFLLDVEVIDMELIQFIWDAIDRLIRRGETGKPNLRDYVIAFFAFVILLAVFWLAYKNLALLFR
jgi:hypothetical protein